MADVRCGPRPYVVRAILDCEAVKHHYEKYWYVFRNGTPIVGFPYLENWNDVREEIVKRFSSSRAV